MIDAVIFDLFGTLIHLPRNTRPYLELCRAIGDSSRIRESIVADAPTLADFCDHLAVSHPPSLADIQRDLDLDIDCAETFPDALETLNALRERDLRIALVSNLASPYKRAVVRLELQSYFDAIVYSCDFGQGKPDPRIYREALTSLDSDPDHTLMVGDSWRSDVEGPMAVGIRGLLVDRSRDSPGDSILRTLTEVTSWLD